MESDAAGSLRAGFWEPYFVVAGGRDCGGADFCDELPEAVELEWGRRSDNGGSDDLGHEHRQGQWASETGRADYDHKRDNVSELEDEEDTTDEEDEGDRRRGGRWSGTRRTGEDIGGTAQEEEEELLWGETGLRALLLAALAWLQRSTTFLGRAFSDMLPDVMPDGVVSSAVKGGAILCALWLAKVFFEITYTIGTYALLAVLVIRIGWALTNYISLKLEDGSTNSPRPRGTHSKGPWHGSRSSATEVPRAAPRPWDGWLQQSLAQGERSLQQGLQYLGNMEDAKASPAASAARSATRVKLEDIIWHRLAVMAQPAHIAARGSKSSVSKDVLQAANLNLAPLVQALQRQLGASAQPLLHAVSIGCPALGFH
eukprot:SM000104S09360  [mRNA]  locus=s104:476733:478604:+ [translate_table: standard]